MKYLIWDKWITWLKTDELHELLLIWDRWLGWITWFEKDELLWDRWIFIWKIWITNSDRSIFGYFDRKRAKSLKWSNIGHLVERIVKSRVKTSPSYPIEPLDRNSLGASGKKQGTVRSGVKDLTPWWNIFNSKWTGMAICSLANACSQDKACSWTSAPQFLNLDEMNSYVWLVSNPSGLMSGSSILLLQKGKKENYK